MQERPRKTSLAALARFDRHFFDSGERFSYIGNGELGGKAQGLAFIRGILASQPEAVALPGIEVSIPTSTVITTDMFDVFIKQNRLEEMALSDARDDQIALAFQQASLPAELVGDLRALIAKVHRPLAVRSSSLAEDALNEPFAGVYATKMIPNNQHDIDTRFRVLTEAIKFVYASTYFREAKAYFKAARKSIREEKMSVIIQEVVGDRFGDRFYPHISGVARSYNFYSSGHAKPEDGVVNLALGLGKTIVDGGRSWIYSPAYPETYPPHASATELLKTTQTGFWAVNMGPAPDHDPIREDEHLAKGDLVAAEADGTLRYLASTYNPERDRIVVGVGARGPRVLTIAPAMLAHEIPLNEQIKRLLNVCEEAVGSEVEIEFAVTLNHQKGLPARFGLLQVRPMFVSQAEVTVADAEMQSEQALVVSNQVLGNGVDESVMDIVYIKPDIFDAKNTRAIAADLERINTELAAQGRPYLLITFGRLGSSDPWLGVPVNWAQVSGARVIVEATLANMNVDLSQGAHFFHNIISFRVYYFSVDHAAGQPINWKWLESQELVAETDFVRHVKLSRALGVKVDGKNGRGVILS